MVKQDLFDKSPVRLFDEATEGGLKAGEIGIVTAKKGLGKTSVLVQFGMDTLLQDKQLAHVTFDLHSSNVISWYDGIFAEIAKKKNGAADLKDDVVAKRTILNFSLDNFTLAKVVFPLMTSAVSAFGKALWANPIGLVIGIIAGAAYLCYKHWDTVSKFLIDSWETVKSAFNAVSEWFSELWEGTTTSISESWENFCTLLTETIPNKIKSLWEGIKNWFKGIFDAILSPIETISKGWDIVKGTVSEKVGGAWQSFKNSLGWGSDDSPSTAAESAGVSPAAAVSLNPASMTSEVNSSMVVTVRTPEGVEATVDNYRSDAPNSTFKAHTETNRGLLR